MNVSLKDKKIEALERMKILGVPFGIVQRFIKDGEVYACEPPFGEFCEISSGDKKRIDDFEKVNSALVYLILRNNDFGFGKMDSYFFVSDYAENEWRMDREDLKNGQALVYVRNYDEPMSSEFGTIGFRNGGLRRA